MAASDKLLLHQSSPSTYTNNDDPNCTPYNSFSSFKSFDNTVVSAYEVGIANGVSGKTASSSKNRNLPVPRVRQSLARKPPSGAKLEYKPAGSITKSKSLTEINTINNRSYKIPHNNAQRFDNRSNKHPEQTSDQYCEPAVNIGSIHDGNSASKHLVSHDGNSAIHGLNNSEGQITNGVKDLESLNTNANYLTNNNKRTNSDSYRFLSNSAVYRGEELTNENVEDGIHSLDYTSVIAVDDTEGNVDHADDRDISVGSLNGADDSSHASSCDVNKTDNKSGLFVSQNSRPLLLTKANKLNGNTKSSDRRHHSLNDGIDLVSLNLVHVNTGNLNQSRLDHIGTGRRYSRRRHLSLQQPPTKADENLQAVELNDSCVPGNDAELAKQSVLSRRKLPKVPDKTTSLTKMADKDKVLKEGKFQEFDNSDSVIGENLSDAQSGNGSPNTGATTQGIPSRKGSLQEQIMVWKRETAERHLQRVAISNKGIDEHSAVQNSESEVKSKRSGRTRTKPNVSGNIEDKFRNKLKEMVASGSAHNAKLSKTADKSNVTNNSEIKHASGSAHNAKLSKTADKNNITNNSEIKHASFNETVPNTISNNAAEINFDLYSQTSQTPKCAKQDAQTVNVETKAGVDNNCVVKELPAFFSFNQDVIQELTDTVMTKPDPVVTKSDHDAIQDYPGKVKQDSVVLIAGTDCHTETTRTRTQDSLNEVTSKETMSSNLSDVNKGSEIQQLNHDQSIEKLEGITDIQKMVDLNQSHKLNIEGKSFNGKADIVLHEKLDTNEVNQEKENFESKESDVNKHTSMFETQGVKELDKTQKVPSQKPGHVLRTPSYRKRVMARAKLRYSKKSQNFKECSCVKKENGELEQCSFCQIFEMKKRSQTSLGHPSLGDYSDSECSDIASPRRALTPEMTGSRSGEQCHPSPRSVRKVNVSPRVDVLMSSNLFKKHLQKHENLLQKHTMSYKRFGMNKSVSNLDLSEGYTVDTDSSYLDNASEMSEPAPLDDGLNQSTDLTKFSDSSTNRRHSLTGDSDIQFSDRDLKAMMRKKSGDTLPSSFTKPKSRPGLGGLFDNGRDRKPPRNNIPSFHEFRKRKEKDSSITNHEHLASVDRSVIEGESACVDTNDMKGQGQGHDSHSDHDLHTVLETDERGSKENLISAGIVTSDDNKQTLEKEVSIGSQETVQGGVGDPGVVIANTNQDDNVLNKSRPRLKSKSRTLPNIDLSVMSDNSSEPSSSQSAREKRRISGKRPRSVLSKKSNADSDTPDTSEKDNSLRQTVAARPKLKGHGKKILRSESDSKYETEKGKNSDDIEELKSKGVHSRHLSLLGKGHNSVSFNLESTQNDGASDVSSSITESVLSDSMYSESYVNETITSIYDTDDFTDGSTHDVSAALKDDLAASVLRSTSDACEITHEAARKRRERKERPYKSDPFSGTEIIPATKRCAIREERARLREHLSFASSSREEILSFLDGVSQTDLDHCSSFPSLEEISEDEHKSTGNTDQQSDLMRKLGKHPSNVSSLSTDSGVIGQEESHDSKHNSPSNTLTHSVSEHRASWQQPQQMAKRSLSASCSNLSDSKNRGCHDCSKDGQHTNQTHFVCPLCEQRQIERKKIIQEVMDTELNYGRDLKILLEEFYKPMLKAGLLTKDQLDCIFLNLDELIHVNVHFITKLKAAINYSNHHEDEDLNDVMIGSLFLESSTMFLTFENYCVNQAQAPILLEQLEREKELLRIFLHVSQSDNHLLRRMHLKSFLMVPVQRIMKYPLLLDRLYKVTLDKHKDKEALREAKEKIEDILGHINAKSKSFNVKQRKGSEKHYSVTEKIEVSRVALETLGWNRKDVCDVITTRLHITQPLDHMWAAKKCKNHKFTTMHGVLLSLVQPNFSVKGNENQSTNAIQNSSNINNNNNNNNNNNKNNNNFTNSTNASVHVVSAAVVLIKEKNGRYQVAREPFMLEKCVVSQDAEFMEVFELLEWNRESYLIKAENPMETKSWVQHLRRQMADLGCWRKRRNALPNILLNHLS